MGWKEYYQICPESYYCRVGRGLLKRILKKPSCSPLAQKESLGLVLGGFSPQSPPPPLSFVIVFVFGLKKKIKFIFLTLTANRLKKLFFLFYQRKNVFFVFKPIWLRCPLPTRALTLFGLTAPPVLWITKNYLVLAKKPDEP